MCRMLLFGRDELANPTHSKEGKLYAFIAFPVDIFAIFLIKFSEKPKMASFDGFSVRAKSGTTSSRGGENGFL